MEYRVGQIWTSKEYDLKVIRVVGTGMAYRWLRAPHPIWMNGEDHYYGPSADELAKYYQLDEATRVMAMVDLYS